MYKYEQKLAQLQRQIAKKKKIRKNWGKHRIKIARLHEKASNIRMHFQHELSCGIINDNQVIISEGSNVKGMVKTPKVAKRISDVAWSEFSDSWLIKQNGTVERITK